MGTGISAGEGRRCPVSSNRPRRPRSRWAGAGVRTGAGGSGTPLYFASRRAVAVGDVFISRQDGLYVWWGHGASDDAWYEARLLPSLRLWLDLPIRHVLVAHGDLVPSEALGPALARPPDDGQ
jgi:hypothetical protein